MIFVEKTISNTQQLICNALVFVKRQFAQTSSTMSSTYDHQLLKKIDIIG